MPRSPARPQPPTRPSPGVVKTEPLTQEARTAALDDAVLGLPSPESIVGGGTTADGVPFLVRASDGTTIEMATGTKPRTAAKADASVFREAGSASPSPFTSALRRDANTDLQGQKGIAKYREMKRTSAAIRSSLRRAKTPIESARWDVIPGADTPIAKKQADFVREVLFNSLDVTWAQTLADILTMLEYGWSILYKVYIREVGTGGGPRIVLAKLAPRHPLDVEHVEYDQFGSPFKVWFYPSGAYEVRTDGNAYPIGTNASSGNIPVEMRHLVVFTLDGEAGDIQGTSILRSAYGHWMIQNALMRIDAIQKERHSLGIPVITLPPGAQDAQLALAEEIGRNLRANERAHVVLPDPNWQLEWAKLSGQPVDPRESLEWHTKQIEANVLWGESDNEYDTFMKSVRYIADRVADTINKWVVKELVDFNWATTKPGTYPRVTARWIGEFEDMRTRSFAIRNLVGADLITPDEILEAQLRKELDLPIADLATRRVVEAPQNPNDPEGEGGETSASQGGTKQSGQQAGKPRQANPKVGPPQANAGTDRSGSSTSR